MTRFTRAVLHFFGHWPCLAAGVVLLWADSSWLAVAWFVASRLAYMLYVGLALRAEERRGEGTPQDARDERWRQFSSRASWLMDNDAIALVALSIVTAGTIAPAVPWTWSIVAGTVLVVVGTVIKVWANASLTPGSYHWRNFFVPPQPHTLSSAGPYRWLSNPMYTLGYAHSYGVAVGLQSAPGVAAAAFAQATILLLHLLVERPHLHRLRAQTSTDGVPAAAAAHEVPTV